MRNLSWYQIKCMQSPISKDILIIGFGNQARAWAMNLRDSGWNVSIALRMNSNSIQKVKNLNFPITELEKKTSFKLVAMLTPDHTHLKILQDYQDNFSNETHFIFAHGYSLSYDNLKANFKNFNFSLLAPKAIASELRFRFESKDGLGAVYESNSEEIIKTLASDLGITHLTKSNALNETVADLFSEQTILCALLPYGALESFNLLIEKGIEPEVAYFECWFEVKLIVDTMVKMGPEKFFEMISPNALIGSQIGKSLFFDETYKKNLNDCFDNIASGSFNEDLAKINIDELKSEVNEFWSRQQLSKTHNELAQKLYTR